MPLRTHGNGNASTTVNITTPANGTSTGAYLVAGGLPCIGVQLVNRVRRTDGTGTYVPAHILLTEHGNVSSGVCQQVRTSRVVNDYFTSTVPDAAGTGNINGAIPVGSSRGIHEARTGG
ncbi:MAG: hypothetical protein MR964_01095 [Campylobacter sp.]|uniref:hypothetical protein n=1 Tax=Campylobacter sp. TaxID=205 RepID=UPI002AA760F5|nr:hypothetical protein [Campylobacter sp.]MCI7022819.1 hypothetical protein [Campylobacter sp.]